MAGAFADVPPGTRDILLAEIAGRVIGYNHVLWRWTEETGTRVYLHLGYLLPWWRGKGIGQAMLRWAQARIREIAAREHATGPRMFATNVSSTEKEAHALMQNHGYVAVRRLSNMVLEPLRDLPPAKLPAGLVLRAVQPEHYQQQALRDRGIIRARLFTDAANGQGARGLYESLGFREVKQHILYRKPLGTAAMS